MFPHPKMFSRDKTEAVIFKSEYILNCNYVQSTNNMEFKWI